MDKQRGRPVLVEFWDFCRVNSLRTLPYVKAWHERYAERRPARHRRAHGGFACPRATRTRCARGRAARDRVPRGHRRATRDLGPLRQRGLAGALPVGPARRAVLDALRRGRLRRDRARDPGAARRRARAAAAACARGRARRAAARADRRPAAAPTPGPYEAGGVWAVLEGAGEVRGQRPRGRRRRARRATRSSSTSATRAACSSSRSAPGVDVPRHLLHAGRWPRGAAPRARGRRAGAEPRRAVVVDERPRCPASRASAFGRRPRKCRW